MEEIIFNILFKEGLISKDELNKAVKMLHEKQRKEKVAEKIRIKYTADLNTLQIINAEIITI